MRLGVHDIAFADKRQSGKPLVDWFAAERKLIATSDPSIHGGDERPLSRAGQRSYKKATRPAGGPGGGDGTPSE
jgi:hypothetical protein